LLEWPYTTDRKDTFQMNKQIFDTADLSLQNNIYDKGIIKTFKKIVKRKQIMKIKIYFLIYELKISENTIKTNFSI